MGLMDHKFRLVALGLLAVFGLLFLIGFSAPVWVSGTADIGFFGPIKYTKGLWKICGRGLCVSADTFPSFAYWRPTQVFETMALIAFFGGGILLVVSFFRSEKAFSKFAMLCIFAAAGLSMLGVIVFGSQTEQHVDYCFYLTLLGSLGMVAPGVLLAVDMRRSTQDSESA